MRTTCSGFETHSDGVVVAVFNEYGQTFRLNMKELEDRIRNLEQQAPGYCPDDDNPVLAELRVRNAAPATTEKHDELD